MCWWLDCRLQVQYTHSDKELFRGVRLSFFHRPTTHARCYRVLLVAFIASPQLNAVAVVVVFHRSRRCDDAHCAKERHQGSLPVSCAALSTKMLLPGVRAFSAELPFVLMVLRVPCECSGMSATIYREVPGYGGQVSPSTFWMLVSPFSLVPDLVALVFVMCVSSLCMSI
jgi:hypothetical protein